MPKLLPALALLCLSTAACTQSMSPGRTPTAYDGTYGGMVQPAQYGPASCGSMTPKQTKFLVQNGSVVWNPVPGMTIYAPVMNGGNFSAMYDNNFAAGYYLSGQITPTGMLAHSDDGACHMTYNLKRMTT